MNQILKYFQNNMQGKLQKIAVNVFTADIHHKITVSNIKICIHKQKAPNSTLR